MENHEAGELGFAWDLEKGDPKYARLSEGLFGRKTVRILSNGKKKVYYYGGILTIWANGKRIPNCHHTILGQSLITIPDMEVKPFAQKIEDLFAELGIPVRKIRVLANTLLHIQTPDQWDALLAGAWIE